MRRFCSDINLPPPVYFIAKRTSENDLIFFSVQNADISVSVVLVLELLKAFRVKMTLNQRVCK